MEFKEQSKSFVAKLFTFIFIFVFIMFLLIDEYTLSQDSMGGDYKQSESVYSFLDCDENGCRPWYYNNDGNKVEAKELFKFYGKDADCADYYRGCESSTDCSSLAVGDCTMKVKNCVYAKDTECRSNYSYGQAGSMELAGNIQVEGDRTYLLGADSEGMHWLKTGEGDQSKTMGINKETSDVHFGGTLRVADDIQMQKTSEISWGNHPNSEERMEVNEDGINFISADKPTMTIGRSSTNDAFKINNLEVNSDEGPGGVSPSGGRPDGGMVVTQTTNWKGNEMFFTPGKLDSFGNNVYFYCDDAALDPSGESGGCY